MTLLEQGNPCINGAPESLAVAGPMSSENGSVVPVVDLWGGVHEEKMFGYGILGTIVLILMIVWLVKRV